MTGTLEITREATAGTVRIALAGELDIAAIPLLRSHLEEVAGETKHIVIDLSQLDFVDSTGLQLLLAAQVQLRARGQALLLRRGRPAVQRLFELTGTSERFSFLD